MATTIKLSKITKVDLRECWQNEASDFTPWLATEENIALLADALGMNELEVRAQEEHVGPEAGIREKLAGIGFNVQEEGV